MPWKPHGRDRKKALALVFLLHLGLGAALWHGLAGEPLRRTTEALTTFDVRLPRPVPPPPAPEAAAEARQAGATDVAARPASVVRPPVEVPLPVPPTLPTSDEAAPLTGSASSAGAGTEPGTGRGAGSGGNGLGGGGGGGTGSALGSEARLVSGNLSRGDYRRIRSFGSPRGQAVLALDVGSDGRVRACRAAASSGDPSLDAELCRLLARTRWEPARDQAGTPVAVTLRYVATWDRD